MQHIGARYIVQDTLHLGVRPEPHDKLDAFIDRNKTTLTLIFHNNWFNMYELPEPLGVQSALAR